jgi:UBX domain-containing protein 1/4
VPLAPFMTKEEISAKQELLKDVNLKIKKQKESEAEDRARILRNIMLDNERRKQQNRRPVLPPESSLPVRLKGPSETAKVSDSAPAETRLKLWVVGLDGSLEKRFSVDAKLSDVAAAVYQEKSVSVASFRTTYLGKVWEETDFGLTLKEAGLVPSAVLFAKRKESLVESGNGQE